MALDPLCTGLPHTDRVVEQVFQLRLDWSLRVCNFSDFGAGFVTNSLILFYLHIVCFNVLLFIIISSFS